MNIYKKTTILMIVLFSLSTILFGQKEYPKIVIDDYFSHIKHKGDSTHNFQIQAAKVLIVDATKFDFSKIKQMNDGNDPDLIHIVCKSGTFIVKLNLKQETIIDKTTAQNVLGKGQFKGFQRGDTPIIGIGTLKMEGTTAALKTFWVSMINIK